MFNVYKNLKLKNKPRGSFSKKKPSLCLKVDEEMF